MTDLLDGGSTESTLDQFDPKKDYWKDLTGEGGKFYDPDPEIAKQKVAFGKLHGDNFISVKNKAFDDLSASYLQLREEANKGPKLQELIDQLSQKLNPSNETKADDESKPVFDPTEVTNLITNQLQQHELQKQRQANKDFVKSKLNEHYGTNYQSAVKQQIDDLGVSGDLFNTLAENNPKLLIKTLGLDQPVQRQDFQAPPRSALRPDSFAPKGGEDRPWSFYQKMKKDKPSQYLSNETQTQMVLDYARLGPKFEDGDFKRFH